MKFNLGFGEEWKSLREFEKLTLDERSIVFYAENRASMNHYREIIEELTEQKNLKICYVTSMKNDPILTTKNQNILSFFIGDGTVRTKFFLTLKARILIMDMPDLETFHIKRSKVYPVHYIYIFHSMFSIHSYLRKGAVDNYDTIFCVGKHHEDEIRETEKVYRLNKKRLIKYGFGRLDTLLKEKNNFYKDPKISENLILIAPSYGKDNLLEVCGIELIDLLLKSNFQVLLRPHFRILQDSKKLMEEIISRFNDNSNFILEKGVIPKEKFYNSTCMISDWSGISLEYAFTFEQPVIFIDVPKKNLNDNVNDISMKPIEISIREKIGHVVKIEEINKIPELIKSDYKNNNMKEQIRKIRSDTVYNIGQSAQIGSEIIEQMYKELEKKN